MGEETSTLKAQLECLELENQRLQSKVEGLQSEIEQLKSGCHCRDRIQEIQPGKRLRPVTALPGALGVAERGPFILVTAKSIAARNPPPTDRNPPPKKPRLNPPIWNQYAQTFIDGIPQPPDWPRRRRELNLEDEHCNNHVLREIIFGLGEAKLDLECMRESTANQKPLDIVRSYAKRLNRSKARHAYEERIIQYQEILIAASYYLLRVGQGIPYMEVDEAMRDAFPNAADSTYLRSLRKGGFWAVMFEISLNDNKFGSYAGEVTLISCVNSKSLVYHLS
jgi:hypothetical protein